MKWNETRLRWEVGGRDDMVPVGVMVVQGRSDEAMLTLEAVKLHIVVVMVMVLTVVIEMVSKVLMTIVAVIDRTIYSFPLSFSLISISLFLTWLDQTIVIAEGI